MLRLAFIILVCALASSNSHAFTFSQAKAQLKNLYKDFPESFYCGCRIEWHGKKLVPDPASCGYEPRNALTKKGKPNARATRIEFEHVVPAWEFGHQLQCWQEGKRKNCTKTNKKFNQMEGDLHNLVPVIGELNGDRSNYKFTMIEGEKRVYGQCDTEVNFKRKQFEPQPSVRGDIARIYLYFEEVYGLRISRKQRQLFTAWDKLDPVGQVECDIHAAKAKLQGNENKFVAERCFR